MAGRVTLEYEPKRLEAEVDKDVLAEAVRNLESVPFDTDRLVVVLANNLAKAAKKRGHDVPLRLDRPSGHFVGMVLRGGEKTDGLPVVLIDANPLVRPVSPTVAAEYVHLFAHEGWHVVQFEAGEDGGVLLERLFERDESGYPFGYMAVEAVNEYRVELSIAQSHERVEIARGGLIEKLLGAVESSLEARKAVDQSSRSNEWAQTLSDDLHDLFGFLGQLAALETLHPENNATALIREHEYWRRLVGDYWEPLCQALVKAEPVSVRMAPDKVDDVVNEVGTLIRKWLPGKLGFTMALVPGGGIVGYSRHVTLDTVAVDAAVGP